MHRLLAGDILEDDGHSKRLRGSIGKGLSIQLVRGLPDLDAGPARINPADILGSRLERDAAPHRADVTIVFNDPVVDSCINSPWIDFGGSREIVAKELRVCS